MLEKQLLTDLMKLLYERDDCHGCLFMDCRYCDNDVLCSSEHYDLFKNIYTETYKSKSHI